MPVVPPLPLNLERHPLYLRMSKCGEAGADCLSKVNAFTRIAEPLADLVIAGPFQHFTLHNRAHATKLLHLMQFIVPPEVVENINPLECLLIIYSAHLHDLGLTLTSHERSEIVGSAEFLDHVRGWSDLWSRLEQTRAQLQQIESSKIDNKETFRFQLEAQIFQIQEAGLCSMMRPKHAIPERYRALLQQIGLASGRNDLFEYQGVSFEDTLIQICASHNQDVAILAEMSGPYNERFPRGKVISGQAVNVQFCAALLRLVDIMDFDRERTPRVLFESLNIGGSAIPGAEVSLREWQKHMAVQSLEVDPHEVVVHAECTHPVIEKSIRDFCTVIERELRDTQAVLRHNTREVQDRYYLSLPITVRYQIISHGYAFRDLSLQMNQAAITSLLMGERLYSEPSVAVRELIENAIDAVAAREVIGGSQEFSPRIEVYCEQDSQERPWVVVKDNGIGMDEHVLGDYFLTLGNTYYSSPEFERQAFRSGTGKQFVPISRFGIGIVSVFMIGDVLEVKTRRYKSPRGDNVGRLVRVERMGGLAFLTETEVKGHGTAVRVRLKEDYASNSDVFFNRVVRYLQANIIRPAYDIHINLAETATVLTKHPYITVTEEGKKYLEQGGFEVVVVDVERWSKRLSGRIVLLFSKTPDGQLSHRHTNRRIVLDTSLGGEEAIIRIKPLKILEGYTGNRIVVNGLRMNLRKILRVVGSSKNKLPAIFDISVCWGLKGFLFG